MTKVWRSLVFLALLPSAALGAGSGPPNVRRFEIRYVANIPAPPAGAQQLQVWLPYPESDAWQSIDNLVVADSAPSGMRTTASTGLRGLSSRSICNPQVTGSATWARLRSVSR